VIEKQITYKNRFNPNEEITDTYWFNLDPSEIATLKAAHKQDIAAYFRRIYNADTTEELVKFYRELIELGVGLRVGNRLDKSPEVRRDFVETGAYDALFMELIMSPDQGVGWINQMFPQDLIERYDTPKTADDYSDDELMGMTNAEFDRVAGPKKNRSKRMVMIAMRRKEMNKERHHLRLTKS
jgi:hypothetical protein